MIIENVIINNEKDYQQFIVKYNDIISRIKSLYDRNSDKDIDPLEINIKADLNLGISFRGNITVPIPKPVRERYIFAAIPNASSNRDDIMMFEKMHDDKVKIVGCEDVSSEIDIPKNVLDDEGNTYKIIAIASNAFYCSKTLSSIRIPDTVKFIGDHAFGYCYRLKYVSLPNSVKTIPEFLFLECISLESVIIPCSVSKIELSAFRSCENLMSIDIPQGVLEIASQAFKNCCNLKTITISSSIRLIDSESFDGCENIESIIIDENNPTYNSNNNSNAIIETSSKRLIKGCKNTVIPNTVEAIGYKAFKDTIGLYRIDIPNSVKKIFNDAFYGCISLESIIIPKSVSFLGGGVFEQCSKLESITIHGPLDVLASGVFRNCISLKSVDIPSTVFEIGFDAFSGCSNLKSITIPDSVECINTNAFHNCRNLESVSLPSSLVIINENIFSGCKSLNTITIDEANRVFSSENNCNAVIKKSSGCLTIGCKNTKIPISVKSIGNCAFENVTELKKIVIPDSVEEIGNKAFYGCLHLESIIIPDTVKSIGKSAFENCCSLTELILSRNIQFIQKKTFSNCTSLTSADIPNGVQQIGESSFECCSSLLEVNIPDTIQCISPKAFLGCINLKSIVFPPSIKTIESGVCEGCLNLTSLCINNSVEKISSSAFKDCINLPTLIIPDTVQIIEELAFCNCKLLQSINIPHSVQTIEEQAFEDCINLHTMTNATGVKEIGERAFCNCNKLNNIELPDNITIGSGVFNNCQSLTNITINNPKYSIVDNVIYEQTENGKFLHSFMAHNINTFTIPDDVYGIKDFAFAYCYNLESITIPQNIKVLGHYAFYFCTNLKSVILNGEIKRIGVGTFRKCDFSTIKIPSSVEYIYNDAFEECEKLVSITIEDGCHSIGSNAFAYCSSLKEITLPESVSLLGSGVFKNCTLLEKVVLPSIIRDLGDNIFQNCSQLNKIIQNKNEKHSDSDYTLEDNAIYDMGKRILISATAVDKNYKIPNSVIRIATQAFAGCNSITVLEIPNNVKFINPPVFTNCVNLEKIIINGNTRFSSDITYSYAGDENEDYIDFLGCDNLKDIDYDRKSWFIDNNILPSIQDKKIIPTKTISNRYLAKRDSHSNFVTNVESATVFSELINNLYSALARSYIQTIFLRNKQHNIGSHVTAKCSDPTFVNELLERNTPNYKPLFDEHSICKQLAENQLAKLNDYNFQRDSYCTDLAESISGSCENITIRDLFYFLDSNTLLLNLISGYDKKFKYHFEIYFEEDQNCANIDDPRLDLQIAIPNGQIGCHAFYNIIENVIRNTAKYAHNNLDNDVAICFRFRTEYQENSSKRLLSNDYYFVEIYSNIEQPDIEKLVDKLNGFVRMPIIDRDTMKPRTEAKGLIEMKASAAYLRGQDIVNLDDDAYTLDEHKAVKDYQEHISVNNKYGVPIQLKAFALCITPQHIVNENATTFFGNRIPVYFHMNSNKKCNYYHYLSEGEDTIHRGFLGYRFFMLKPKNVLLVGDAGEKNTTVPSEYGIDLWSIQQLEEHLINNNNVHYDIMICSEEDILSKYKSRLPKRIIKMSAAEFIQNFISKHPDYNLLNPKNLSLKIEAFAWSMYPEWLKAHDYKRFSTSSCPCFSNHLRRLTKEKFEAKEYIEALSSAAQQKLPNFLRLSDNKGLPHYTEQAWSDPLTLYRILESINTKVLLLDEDIQLEAKAPPTSLRELNIDLKLHLQKCRIDIPDINLVGITPEDAIKVIERVKEEGKNYDFIFFHYGLLERMFEQMDDGQLIRLRTLYPGINSDSHDRKKIMVDYLKTLAKEHDVVIKSGRGIPETLPPSVRFIPQVNVNQALKELKSKYLFSNQLYASR